jgi:hypothetical protein
MMESIPAINTKKVGKGQHYSTIAIRRNIPEDAIHDRIACTYTCRKEIYPEQIE